MMSVATRGYFDTNVLANFAAIDRLDILEERWGHRAAWTDAVRDEVSEGQYQTSYMSSVLKCGWLGEPISFTSHELASIQLIRSVISSVDDPPTKNLGEAELIHCILDHGGILITDDRVAADYARRRNIQVYDTCDIMCDAYAMSTTTCPETYEILQKMDDAGRQNVRIPRSHKDVC